VRTPPSPGKGQPPQREWWDMVGSGMQMRVFVRVCAWRVLGSRNTCCCCCCICCIWSSMTSAHARPSTLTTWCVPRLLKDGSRRGRDDACWFTTGLMNRPPRNPSLVGKHTKRRRAVAAQLRIVNMAAGGLMWGTRSGDHTNLVLLRVRAISISMRRNQKKC